jgi:antitoxin YefM
MREQQTTSRENREILTKMLKHAEDFRIVEILCTTNLSGIFRKTMKTLPMDEFCSTLPNILEQVIVNHRPIKVTQQTGQDVIVMSAEDWEQDQETLYVLQNQALMEQIAESLKTYIAGTGYIPTPEELDEITRI